MRLRRENEGQSTSWKATYVFTYVGWSCILILHLAIREWKDKRAAEDWEGWIATNIRGIVINLYSCYIAQYSMKKSWKYSWEVSGWCRNPICSDGMRRRCSARRQTRRCRRCCCNLPNVPSLLSCERQWARYVWSCEAVALYVRVRRSLSCLQCWASVLCLTDWHSCLALVYRLSEQLHAVLVFLNIILCLYSHMFIFSFSLTFDIYFGCVSCFQSLVTAFECFHKLAYFFSMSFLFTKIRKDRNDCYFIIF